MTASTTSRQAAPAGGRRFWLTVMAFALANALAWVGYHHHQQSRTSGLLRVERATPADGGTVAPGARLTWTFNLDVAPPAPPAPPAPAASTDGRPHASAWPPADGQAPATIVPAVPGTWHWPNPRMLTFKPADPLPKATRFTVTIPAGRLRTPGGFTLDKPYTSTFQTAPLSLVGARQTGFVDGDRAILELTFDDAVLPADVMRHLTLAGPDGKPLACEPHGDAPTGEVVRVRTAPLPQVGAGAAGAGAENAVRVTISAGLAGRSGPLAMTTAAERAVPVDAGLVATEISATSDGQGGAGIRVEFNHDALDLASVRQVLSVEPAVAFTASGSYGSVDLAGDFEAGTRYAVRLAAPPAGADRSRFPRPAVMSVFVPDHPAAVWFEHADAGYLGSRGNRTLLAHAVNAFDLTVRVTRLYDNNLVQWRTSSGAGGGRSWRGDAVVEDFGTPVVEKRIRLPQRKNEKQEVRVALDEVLTAGAARDGAYRVELVASRANGDGDEGDDDDFDFGRYARRRGSSSASTVVTLSDLGLTAKTGKGGATAWVTSLSGGGPVAGVRLRVFSDKNQPLGEAVSGADGLASIALAAAADGESPAVVIADRPGDGAGADLTWLDLRTSAVRFGGEADTGGRAYLREGYEAFVYTDRGVYRPGETVHLRAIVRGPDDATPTPFPVTFQLVRPDQRNWRAHATMLDADGAAGFELALPADLATGKWTAKIGLSLASGEKGPAKWFGSATFQVEEFMPDRMKVELALGGGSGSGGAGGGGKADASRVSLGDGALPADVQADYLFGRPVASRPATLVARVDPAKFAPVGWSGWTFHDAADTAGPLGIAAPLGRRTELPVSNLDRAGHARWDVDVQGLIEKGDPVDADAPPAPGNAAFAGPWTLTTTVSVTEEGGRAVSATRKVDVDLVHYYVGLRKPAGLVRPKAAHAFELALVDPAGKAGSRDEAMLKATLYRESWNNSLVRENGRYRYESTRVLDAIAEKGGEDDDNAAATVALGDDGRSTCMVTPPSAGSYVLRVVDEQTGVVASVAFYAGDNAWDDQISREDPERLEVVVLPPGGGDAYLDAVRQFDLDTLGRLARAALAPRPATDAADPAAFLIGDRPRVLVRSPFKGRLLLTVETDTVVSSRVIDMPASQVTVPIDVTEAWRPNAYVTATVVRAVDPDAKWRAHRATGVARLRVDNTDRRLNVEIAAPEEMRPATTLDAAVRVTDAAGRPVADAPVTVAAVDEGVLRLTDFKTPDPFGHFTADRALASETADLYGQLMPEVPKPDKASAPGGDGDADDGGRYRSPVSARRVKPVALFSGVVRTGADGVARVSFPVPQFAGQLRLMAVAHHAGATSGYGSADVPVTVRSPLIVQSSWPRFAAPGDRFTVPLVAFNSGTTGGDVELRMEIAPDAAGTPPALKFNGGLGDGARVTRSLRIAAAGQASDAIDVVALDRVGVAKIRLVAMLAGETFEETVELPIRPASPAMTTGGYASATVVRPASITVPDEVIPGTGDFRLNVTPWPSLELPQGLEYLDRYPYGCAEQTISTLLPLVYLGDIGERVAPHLFDRTTIANKVQAGVVRLLGMRNADGGIGMWSGDRASWPWASVYAAHFAVEARAAGHEVPDDFYDGLLGYARSLLAKPGDGADTLEAQAYACYVLALAGKPERATMSRLGEVLSKPAPTDPAAGRAVPAHARFHLAAAWLAAGRRDLADGLIPDALPSPRAGRQHAGNLGSPVRDQAVMLSALVAVQPDRPDVPALAQSLADAGRAGRWRSTQDTAFAVLALGRYLKQASTGDRYDAVELWRAGERLATAKAGEALAWNSTPPVGTPGPLEVRVAGPANAKAHVSWLRTGVPPQSPADVDRGIKVRRRYLDDRGHPLRDNAVRSGDLVKVELTLDAASALENVVIEDLLPAGLEIENPRLVTQAAAMEGDGPAIHLVPLDPDRPRPEFAVRRLDMRDDRLILVGDLTMAGAATYVYTARAVAPGAFAVPPVRAECMYDIGTSSIAGGSGELRVTQAGKTGLADAANE